MKRYLKLIVILVLACIMTFEACCETLVPRTSSDDRTNHDGDIEYVLFGNRQYKKTHPKVKDRIQALEDAVYLALDEYNEKGQRSLDSLCNDRKIPGIVSDVRKISFNGNYAHRELTHKGWNYEETSAPTEANWPERKKILYETVKKEVFSETWDILDWWPELSDAVFGASEEQRINAFCKMLYYIHILGDHLQAENYKALSHLAPLVNKHDRDNPGAIPELISCFKVLFESKKLLHPLQYNTFIKKLNQLREEAWSIYSQIGGINTDERFEQYHSIADRLLYTLGYYFPGLIKKESFFKKSFYP